MVFAEETGSVHGRLGVPLSTRPRMAEADWQKFGEALTEVADHLTRRGMRLAYHHHMGTVVETEDEIDRLMRVTGPAVGLLLDTGHLTYAGGDVLAVARRHAHRIVHVHCKDIRPAVLVGARKRDQSFLDSVVEGVFTVPGDGCVDYKALLDGPARRGLLGLAGRGGGAGSEEGPPAHLRADGLRPPEPAARRPPDVSVPPPAGRVAASSYTAPVRRSVAISSSR